MKSNRLYHLMFKYGFLLFGLLFIIIPVISYIAPDQVEINGKKGSLDKTDTILFILIGVTALLTFLLLKEKFRMVELTRQDITVFINGEPRKHEWLEIEKLNQIQFVYPPLYKLKFKNSDRVIFFNTRNSYVSINGYMKDLSEMGALINEKKKELGI